MKVQGMTDPGRFTVERVPATNKTFVRLFQNVTPIETEDFKGYEYDEYHVEVETWDGVAENVSTNYDVFLQRGIEAEIDKSNDRLYRDQQITAQDVADADELNIDHEYRITMLELGI